MKCSKQYWEKEVQAIALNQTPGSMEETQYIVAQTRTFSSLAPRVWTWRIDELSK